MANKPVSKMGIQALRRGANGMRAYIAYFRKTYPDSTLYIKDQIRLHDMERELAKRGHPLPPK